MKIAILSGRAQNGTILPKKEKYVWNEVCRVLKEEMKQEVFQNATLLIPIYSKFDLQALYYAEKNGNKVEYYVPNNEWGKKYLPTHQIKLVERMQAPRHINPSHNGRINDMIKDADLVYVLTGTAGVSDFTLSLVGKNIIPFPQEKMRFKTEEEAVAFHEQISKNTRLHTSLKKIQQAGDEQISQETQDFLNQKEKNLPVRSLDQLLNGYQSPSEEDIMSYLKEDWSEDLWSDLLGKNPS